MGKLSKNELEKTLQLYRDIVKNISLRRNINGVKNLKSKSYKRQDKNVIYYVNSKGGLTLTGEFGKIKETFERFDELVKDTSIGLNKVEKTEILHWINQFNDLQKNNKNITDSDKVKFKVDIGLNKVEARGGGKPKPPKPPKPIPPKPTPPTPPIPIPDDPELFTDRDRAELERIYRIRKNDMYAKYYGNKDYLKEYQERAKRHRLHEIEISENGINFKTIEDYPEKEDDEKFLLLEDYKLSLERKTKYENGDNNIYVGNDEEIKEQYEKDKQYVETRNFTFNQHKHTQKDLETLGKYGEKMSYIPIKSDSTFKNIGIVALNVGIFARNLISPIYRVTGKFIAKPIHEFVFKNDPSPYKNNMYHRMIARRDYFYNAAKMRDEEETRQNIQRDGRNAKIVKHPIKNFISSRYNALFKIEEGNDAVLRAGLYDIRENVKAQITSAVLQRNEKILAEQIRQLEFELICEPDAKNANLVKNAIKRKKNLKNQILKQIEKRGKTITEQTDAIDSKQHAIASKEVNTLRTTAISGFVKGLTVRYIGPNIRNWLVKHTKIKTQEWIEPTTTKEWVEPTTEKKWIPESSSKEFIDEQVKQVTVQNTKTIADTSVKANEIINKNANSTITGYYSVHGGERNPAQYVLQGNEKITAIFNGKTNRSFSDIIGSKESTGFTNGTFSQELLTTNGYLKQDTKLENLLQIFGSNVDKEKLSEVYVSINDQYWVRLSDLCNKMTKTINMGEKVVNQTIPAHWEEIVIPGHYEEVDIAGYWKDVITPGYYEDVIVDNPRVIKAMEGIGMIKNRVIVGTGIQDIAENLRNTNSKTQSNKKGQKNYKYNPSNENIPKSRKEYKELYGLER